MSDARQTRYDRRRRSCRTNSEFDSIRGEYRFFECRKTGSQTESKNRFIRFFPYRYTTLETIECYLHCNDTQHNPARGQPSHDKLCHIRPILDDVLDKCKNNYNPHKEQSIDEAMIGFKGRLGFKQYLPAKPTRLQCSLVVSTIL